MDAWYRNLENEYFELGARIDRLQRVLEEDNELIRSAQKELMRVQLAAMAAYRRVVMDRLLEAQVHGG